LIISDNHHRAAEDYDAELCAGEWRRWRGKNSKCLLECFAVCRFKALLLICFFMVFGECSFHILHVLRMYRMQNMHLC